MDCGVVEVVLLDVADEEVLVDATGTMIGMLVVEVPPKLEVDFVVAELGALFAGTD